MTIIITLISAVASVMDSHSCDLGSNPSQGKSHNIRYAVNSVHIR